MKKIVVKCYNKKIHRRSDGEGRILAIFGQNTIYLHCKDRDCKRWTRLDISFPGVRLDFSKAAIVQTKMPEDYHFDLAPATVVIGDGDE